MPAGIVLYWALPRWMEGGHRRAPLALGLSIVGFLIFVYTLLAGHAHVRLLPNRLVIQGPLYPVVVSYQRVTMVRSVEFRQLFSPEQASGYRWRLYRSLWGKTVPAVDLKGLPLPRWWLRLWLHPFLIHPNQAALIFPIEDWLTFIHRLETLRTARAQRTRYRA
jgi:hypothetical protein